MYQYSMGKIVKKHNGLPAKIKSLVGSQQKKIELKINMTASNTPPVVW